MSIPVAYIKLSIGLALTSVALFTASASAQSPATNPNGSAKDIAAAAAEPDADSEENAIAGETPGRDDLKAELEAEKKENAAIRELLRKMQEQQKTLLERVDRLPALTNQPALTSPASTSELSASVSEALKKSGRYNEGIIIWQTADDVEVPFLLKINDNTQVRYLNSLSADETFTDHLGNVLDFKRRNDITVNRSMFILGGYIFNKKVVYSLTVWTSAGSASIVVAGNIGWQFNKYFTLIGGYTGVPGSRSLVNTFPYWTQMDRSMGDNFFRPAFTQGVWATGELPTRLNYLGFVGNGLNTLNISAQKIDTSLLF